jgi:DNA-binding response OmpR family regulator
MGLKVLLVDDNRDAATAIAAALRIVGDYEVHTAFDGGEAIEKASALQPDVVLLDIGLPVLDGFEVLEELKRREIKTRVIMMSGQFMDIDTAVRCIRNGACDFFTKPCELSKISNCIRRHMLTGSTINLAPPAPMVQVLLSRIDDVKRREIVLAEQNKRLRAKDRRAELLLKTCYVGLSLIASAILSYFKITTHGLALLSSFVVLTLLLMIPIDRIQRITTRLPGLRTKINLGRETFVE